MVSIKEKIAAQNEGIVADNQATSQPTPMKEPAQQIEPSGSTQELENKVVRAPIEARPKEDVKAEPVSTQEPKTGSEMIGQPKQAVSAPNNVEEASKEIGIRDYIRTRNRLSSIQSGQDVIKGVQDGTVGGAELDFIKSNTPELFEAYNQALDEKKSLDAVNRSSKLTDDEEVQEALNVFQQIQDIYMKRMKAFADNAVSQEDIYNKYLDTPELNEKFDKYQNIQKEIIELNNIMRQTEDDVREQSSGQASESYIRALASNQNKAIQRQVDMLEDDRWFAQVDYNTALGSAERRFEFEWADTQAQRDFDQQLVQTQLGMDMQSFGMAWDTLMADKAKEEKKYWYGVEMADKVKMVELQNKLGIEKAEELMKMEVKYAKMNGYSSSDFIKLDDGRLYNTKTESIVDPLGGGNISGFKPGTGNYIDSVGTISGYGSKYWEHGLDIAPSVEGTKPDIPTGFSGVVSTGVDPDGFGNYVKVTMDDGSTVQYSHLDTIGVNDGDRINAGQSVGTMGNTGNVYSTTGGNGTHVDITMKDAEGNYLTPTQVRDLHNMQSADSSSYKDDLVFDAGGIITLGSKFDQETALPYLAKAIENGDKEAAYNKLAALYQKSMGVSFRQAKGLRTTMATYLNEIEDSMVKLNAAEGGFDPFLDITEDSFEYDDEGKFGFKAGVKENIANRIGETSDPELKQLQITTLDFLDQLARARTGAAMTVSEERFYDRLLPSIGKDFENNMATIAGLRDSLLIGDKAEKMMIAGNLGDKMNERLFGEDEDMLEELGFYVPSDEETDDWEFDLFMSQWNTNMEDITSGVPKMPNFN